MCQSGRPDLTGQRHIPDAEGRVDSIDSGIFIHAIVPRHCEVVCLLSNRKSDSYLRRDLQMENYHRIKDAEKEQDKK